MIIIVYYRYYIVVIVIMIDLFQCICEMGKDGGVAVVLRLLLYHTFVRVIDS